MKLKINGLQHIGIPVTDIIRSGKFYKLLGFENVMQASFDYNNDNGTCIMMQFGKIIIELYQMPEEELKNIRLRKDGYIDHIAFDVDDIEETFLELSKNGFQIIESQPVFLNFREKSCWYFNITGPEGERLEFNQIG